MQILHHLLRNPPNSLTMPRVCAFYDKFVDFIITNSSKITHANYEYKIKKREEEEESHHHAISKGLS